jgi:hypothetical protein
MRAPGRARPWRGVEGDMRSSRTGRYVLVGIGLVIVLGGWLALEATERQLRRRMGRDARGASRAAPGAAAASSVSTPRATGPMAGMRGASGASGPSAPRGEGEEEAPPPSESGADKSVPPGAIW